MHLPWCDESFCRRPSAPAHQLGCSDETSGGSLWFAAVSVVVAQCSPKAIDCALQLCDSSSLDAPYRGGGDQAYGQSLVACSCQPTPHLVGIELGQGTDAIPAKAEEGSALPALSPPSCTASSSRSLITACPALKLERVHWRRFRHELRGQLGPG